MEPPDRLHFSDGPIITDSFIVGIDPQKFTDTLQKPEVESRIKDLEEKYKDTKIILGVDRLDYIKGLTLKLKAYDEFLDAHKSTERVVLIQVAVPSREDVKEYQDLETEISTLVGKINGKHGELGLFDHYIPTHCLLTSASNPRRLPHNLHAPLRPLHRTSSPLRRRRRLPPNLHPRRHEPRLLRVHSVPRAQARRATPV